MKTREGQEKLKDVINLICGTQMTKSQSVRFLQKKLFLVKQTFEKALSRCYDALDIDEFDRMWTPQSPSEKFNEKHIIDNT